MGRIRIKKKEVVLPFQQTLAYRMILLTASIVVFVISLVVMVGAMQTNMVTFVTSSAIGVLAAVAAVYNLNHLREAKIPKQTLQRMKRR
jgi:integral membrane sensor domain MASE1